VLGGTSLLELLYDTEAKRTQFAQEMITNTTEIFTLLKFKEYLTVHPERRAVELAEYEKAYKEAFVKAFKLATANRVAESVVAESDLCEVVARVWRAEQRIVTSLLDSRDNNGTSLTALSIGNELLLRPPSTVAC